MWMPWREYWCVRGHIQTSGWSLLLLIMMKTMASEGESLTNSLTSIPHQTDTHDEYCHYETFRARCAEGEVILIRSALYGRMRLGQCVKQSLGYLGCFTDVIDILDVNCSGRQTCQLAVTDPTFQNRKPCSEEIKNYLQVRYSCITVSTPPDTSCILDMTSTSTYLDTEVSTHDRAMTDRGVGGFLPSPRTHLTHCGTHQTPWLITAAQGQRINLTLIDFSRASHTAHSDTAGRARASKICFKYGSVAEDDGKITEDICASHQRATHIYMSQSHSLQITLSDNANFYLLSYQAVGCPHLANTDQRWVRVTGSHTLTAGCRNSERSWHLRCQGNRWVGTITNCSHLQEKDIQSNSLDGLQADIRVLPPVFTIGVVLGVAVTISVCIVVIGLICLKRLRDSRSQKGQGDILLRSGGGGAGGERLYSPPSLQTPADLWANEEPLYTCRSEYCHCGGGGGGGGGTVRGSQASLRQIQQDVVYAPASAFTTYSTNVHQSSNKATAGLDLVPSEHSPPPYDVTGEETLNCDEQTQSHTEL